MHNVIWFIYFVLRICKTLPIHWHISLSKFRNPFTKLSRFTLLMTATKRKREHCHFTAKWKRHTRRLPYYQRYRKSQALFFYRCDCKVKLFEFVSEFNLLVHTGTLLPIWVNLCESWTPNHLSTEKKWWTKMGNVSRLLKHRLALEDEQI